MAKNAFIRCCRSVRHLPTSMVCIVVLFIQAACLDYYLAKYKGEYWAAWAAADLCAAILCIISFALSYRHLRYITFWRQSQEKPDSVILPFSFVAWGFYAVVLCVKVSIIFKDFAFILDETAFFGPNTLKTAIALAGLVFLLLLSTQHEAKPGTEQKRYIEELTGTVVFDILDGVDSMEILFLKEARDNFPPGMDDAIIAIACINFLLPTIPLVTLSRTHFGNSKLPQRFVVLHKLALAFLVNLPLLITRMIVWHGLSRGISIFSLKNIIVIAMVSYDFYEHHESDEPSSSMKEKDKATGEHDGESYALEDRFGYM